MFHKAARIFAMVLLLACTAAVLAGELPDAELKTTAVAAFKNGLGFFIRQGNARLAGGEGRIVQVPQATLGSLWLAPNDPGASLDELVAFRYPVTKSRAVTSIEEIFRANVGKTVTVTYNQHEYTGEIIALEKDEGQPGIPTPLRSAEEINAQVRVPSILLLKVEGRTLAMRIGNVTLLTLPDGPVLRMPLAEEARALRFKLKGAGDTARLTMGYLQKGFGWTPSYLVSLQDDKTAQLTMQAVVTNDVEDVSDTDLFFVVGFPNFAYSDVLSPMALQRTLAEFMRDAETDRTSRFANNNRNNALTAQMSARMEGDMVSNEASFSTTVTELVGAPEEDLFLYNRSHVTMAKGERATYNVFSGGVGLEHIYEWAIGDSSRVDSYGNPQQSPSDGRSVDNVWHSLRMKNTTKFPWTSAPALVISGTQQVSQDTLPYTPKGATSNLKLTIATDVRTKRQELEIERVPRSSERRGYNLDAVTVEGTLTVKNYKSKDIRLNIQKALVGEVLSVTDAGKTEKLAEAVRWINPTSRITWEISLKAGEEKTITYRYKILVRA